MIISNREELYSFIRSERANITTSELESVIMACRVGIVFDIEKLSTESLISLIDDFLNKWKGNAERPIFVNLPNQNVELSEG